MITIYNGSPYPSLVWCSVSGITEETHNISQEAHYDINIGTPVASHPRRYLPSTTGFFLGILFVDDILFVLDRS